MALTKRKKKPDKDLIYTATDGASGTDWAVQRGTRLKGSHRAVQLGFATGLFVPEGLDDSEMAQSRQALDRTEEIRHAPPRQLSQSIPADRKVRATRSQVVHLPATFASNQLGVFGMPASSAGGVIVNIADIADSSDPVVAAISKQYPDLFEPEPLPGA